MKKARFEQVPLREVIEKLPKEDAKREEDSNFKRIRLPSPEGRLIIQSTCVVCGQVLQGDVTEGHRETEKDHILKDCTTKKKKSQSI
jgi:hypothetical protein